MNNKKSIPVLDARTIFFEYLTEQEEQAIERGRKEVDYLLEPAYKLLDHLPPNVLEDASDAIELAIGGGEANGFCAGFYYALRMMEGLRSGAVQYYAPEQAKGGGHDERFSAARNNQGFCGTYDRAQAGSTSS